MSVWIAVDIGGTSMRAACYPERDILPQKHKKIPTQLANEQAWDRLVSLIRSVWPKDESVAGIGVAAPGPVDPYQGIILSAPNIPAWKNFPLAEELNKIFAVPVVMGNDANLATLGEWNFGAGQGHRHLVYVTVSTGIGCGVIADGKLLLGRQGLAAELGHIPVWPEGPLCGCGQRGHLEALASGPSIARWVKEELKQGSVSSLSNEKQITTVQIAEAARDGDSLATLALARAGAFIGEALVTVLHLFNPSIVVIGGGVSQTGELIMAPMRATMQAHVMTPNYTQGLILTTAALGDETGLLGALALARGNV